MHRVFYRILFGFAEEAFTDEIEDDVPDVDAVVDTPFGEDAPGYRAILLECIDANTFEQLLTVDVARLVELSNRVFEPSSNKQVGFSGIALIR